MGRYSAVRGGMFVITSLVATCLCAPLAAPASAAGAAVGASPGRSFTSLLPAAGSTGQAALVLGDGTRVIGGSAGGDFALYRYAASETPDATFGGDGYVTTDFGGRVDVVRALARAAGSGVVAAGSSSGDVAVARYDMFGDLDRAFGTEGRVLTDLGGADDTAHGVVVQPSGKVVVAGGNASSTVVRRYLADGRPDTTFGSGGRLLLPWGRAARALVAQPDGAMIVVGAAGGSGIDVARVDAEGALDPTFGTGGSVRLATGAGTSANAATLLSDGRILVAGGRVGDVLLARLLPTGEVDPSLGAGGIATSDLGRTETANGVTMVPDGRIRVVGEATDGTGFAAAYLPDGVLDTTGGSPRVTEPLRGIVYQSGKMATAGTRDGLMSSDAATLDFGAAAQKAYGAARQADGKTVVIGQTSGIIGLLRFTADGVLDPTFGSGGKVVSDLAWFPRSVVVQAGGRIVVAGHHRQYAAMVAFGPDGSVDLTFGTAGRVLTDAGQESPSALSILPDGKLLLGGGEGTVGVFLAQYSSSGAPDLTFGDGGLIRGAFPGAGSPMRTLRQPDKKTLATSVDYSVSRFNPDGSPDMGFGDEGTVWMDPSEFYFYRNPAALALQPDGRILVGGTWLQGEYRFAIIRLNADGSRDSSWPTVHTDPRPDDGFRPDELRKLFLQPDGKVVALSDEVAIRYHGDGTIDETFGLGGRAYLEHTAISVTEAFFDGDGLLWSVGSGGTGSEPSGFVLTVNRIPESGRFHALAPVRILDTRSGNGAPVARVGPDATLRLQVVGRGGVPARGVSAVVVNLTVTEPTEGTYLTVWPAGASRPLASNLNVVAGQTLPNLVTVAVGTDGGVNLYNFRGSAHLVADVAGWYGDGTDAAGARYHPLAPARVLDTRSGNGALVSPLGPGSTLELQVTGRGGVPATGVSAVVMNLTAVSPTAGTYVTAWPTGRARPLASNLNVVADQTAPNLVVVAVGSGGRVSLFNLAGAVHLVADVAGWYGDGSEAGGARFHAFTPARFLDTRSGNGAPIAPIGPAASLDVQVAGRAGVPATDVSAVILNVTVTEPTASTHLTVWPTGQAQPLTSNLNFRPGQTVANLVMVGVGPGGRVSIFNAAGYSHVVVDVAGWYGGQ